MKNNVTDNLNEIFGIESELVDDTEQLPVTRDVTPKGHGDIEKDYNFARENLYDVISQGSDALSTLLELAKASEHPRAFEVVSTLTKTLVDANKDLLEIQKKVKELKKETDAPANNSTQNVTNALFVGSTSDLQKLIKGDDGD